MFGRRTPPPPSDPNRVRVIVSGDGHYVHTGDLARMIVRNVPADKAVSRDKLIEWLLDESTER